MNACEAKMNLRGRLGGNRGFTLVALLVVIARIDYAFSN
jgi:type II secretory pathway pseudopilin PulG